MKTYFSGADASRSPAPPILLWAMIVGVFSTFRLDAAQSAPGFPGYTIYRGNTHAHTTFTSSHGQKPPFNGPPAEHHRLAKEAGYDFYATTDHSHEKIFLPPRIDNRGWVAVKQQADEATDDRFVGFAGFEFTENDGGAHPGKCHINVINSDDYLDAAAPGVDLPELYRWLKSAAANPGKGGGPVVATFNHPIDKVYPMTTWAYRDDAVTDIITLLEVINASEYIHEAGFQAALAAGWKVSPVSGNDHHNFAGITALSARTFVVATDLSRRSLLEAMRQRRTYASMEQNLACCYSVNEAIMGSTLKSPDKFEFAIFASDPDPGRPDHQDGNSQGQRHCRRGGGDKDV